MAAEPIFES